MVDTHILDSAIARRKKLNEAVRTETFANTLDALVKAEEHFRIGNACLYGSVVERGRFCNKSDIDVAVEGVTSKDFFRLRSFLEDALGREVDLTDLADAPISEKIKKRGIPWKTVQ